MRDHDEHGSAMRDAIVRADLLGAKREAHALAHFALDGATEPTWRANVDSMRAGLDRVAQAANLDDASRALATVARSCGDCHAANQISGFLLTGHEPRGVSVIARMTRHGWAMARLWDALIGPSNDAWNSGISALQGAPLEPERLTPGQSPVPEIAQLERAVRALATQGRTAESVLEREIIYGRLMTTCSACHRRLGGGPDGP